MMLIETGVSTIIYMERIGPVAEAGWDYILGVWWVWP